MQANKVRTTQAERITTTDRYSRKTIVYSYNRFYYGFTSFQGTREYNGIRHDPSYSRQVYEIQTLRPSPKS